MFMNLVVTLDHKTGREERGRVVRAEEERRHLAKMNDQVDEKWRLPEIFFNYEGGKPRCAVPVFRFNGSKTGVLHVCAIGEAACDMLAVHGHKITRNLGQFYGKPLPEHRYTRDRIETGERRFLIDYYISTLLIIQNPYQHQAYKNDLLANRLTPQISKRITQLIRDGILDQADIMGIDIEHRDFAIGDISVGYYVPIEVKPGKHFIAARQVRFRSSMDIRPATWNVGLLKNKGFGLVIWDQKVKEKQS